MKTNTFPNRNDNHFAVDKGTQMHEDAEYDKTFSNGSLDVHKDHLEILLDKVEAYLGTTMSITRLKIIDNVANFTSRLITGLVLGVLFVLFIVMIHLGLAVWIGQYMGQLYLGFLMISGFYFLVLVIVYIFRRPIIQGPVFKSVTGWLLR